MAEPGVTPRGAGARAWLASARALRRAQFAEARGKLVLTVLALAVGVALITMIYLVNAAAVAEFDAAARELAGRADLVVRGPRAGFDERLYPRLAAAPLVAVASPALEVEAALADGRTLTLRGVDAFRLRAVQPALALALAPYTLALLDAHAVVVSGAAAAEYNVRRGGALTVRVGAAPVVLEVVGVLPMEALEGSVALMDLGSAQWTLGALGRLSRIDLALADHVTPAAARRALAPQLPAGVWLTTPEVERDRTSAVSLAYRLNLNMLALIALLTGAFLVYSTQSLAVQRRRPLIGLLRALGVRRGELVVLLVGEGALLGALGGLLGAGLGYAGAALLLARYGADLGGGYFRGALSLAPHPLALLAFVTLGMLVAALGAWWPARAAAAIAPAEALRATPPPEPGGTLRPATRAALAAWLCGALALAVRSPPGMPYQGYVAIACFLLGALGLVPFVAGLVLGALPRSRRPLWRLARAQVVANAARSRVSLAALIVSFSLMVAMTIMVHSFRDSFVGWLNEVLPADLNLRVPQGSTTAQWDLAAQARVAALAGVARVDFRRVDSLLLDPTRPPVALIARALDARHPERTLPLVARVAVADSVPAVYVSEAIEDLYGWRPGDTVRLPLAGHEVSVRVAGIWRDYARSFGAIVLDRAGYVRLTGESGATEAGVWLAPGADAPGVEQALRTTLAAGGRYEVLATGALKARSLVLFDRAFAVTYLLEAIAVGLGLLGVSFAFSAQALARRAEFGLLRHLGLRRRDVTALVALEGAAMGLAAVLYGLLVGAGLSLVLIYVVNRQSFHWSLDLHVPVGELLVAATVLVVAAAATSALSARAATGTRAVAAVREDW